jgi:hypothetical protein
MERIQRFYDWFETVLASDDSALRRRAIQLLGESLDVCAEPLLLVAECDSDPSVRAIVPLVRAVRAARQAESGWELRESDFAADRDGSPLRWEWEYVLAVCRPACVPDERVIIWVREEDDDLARELAVMKFCRAAEAVQTVALIVQKRYVNAYTRQARSRAEAARWRKHGRPRYVDPG